MAAILASMLAVAGFRLLLAPEVDVDWPISNPKLIPLWELNDKPNCSRAFPLVEQPELYPLLIAPLG